MRKKEQFSIPRLGMEGDLPEGLPEPVVIYGEQEVTVDPPKVGDKVNIPRLDITGKVVKIKEVATEDPAAEKTE